jgi:hypothetical protein
MTRKSGFSLCITCVCVILIQTCFAQSDTGASADTLKNRRWLICGSGMALYTGSMVGLNALWYRDYPRSGFHSFDDSGEWLQMDKAGHGMASYYLGLVGYESLRYAGVKKGPALLWGGGTGFLYLTGIEILDGFSTEWGFSWSDELANLTGAAAFIAQQAAWDDQRIKLKFSFQPSEYAALRPALFGSDFSAQMLKDYNGQTYWASVNIYSFINSSSRFPKWLNVAVGYGIDGVIYGEAEDQNELEWGSYSRQRQVYLSLDVDLTRIETKSKFLRTVTKTIGFIKFPAPTISLTGKQVNGHWLHF